MAPIPQDQRALFRRRLVELVGLDWRYSRALPAEPDVDLARDLGVTPDVLAAAIEVRRSGFRLPPSKSKRSELRWGYLHYSWRAWTILSDQVERAAKQRDENAAGFVRSFLHACMQTTFEPVTRTQPIRTRTEMHRRVIPMSRALYHTLSTRAAALGLTTGGYCNLWLCDYFARRLPPIKIVSIGPRQCFDDPALYALPVFAGEERPDGAPPT